jgi:hypothetical protein
VRQKSLTEAAGPSGRAGVKIRQQMPFVGSGRGGIRADDVTREPGLARNDISNALQALSTPPEPYPGNPLTPFLGHFRCQSY